MEMEEQLTSVNHINVREVFFATFRVTFIPTVAFK